MPAIEWGHAHCASGTRDTVTSAKQLKQEVIRFRVIVSKRCTAARCCGRSRLYSVIEVEEPSDRKLSTSARLGGAPYLAPRGPPSG